MQGSPAVIEILNEVLTAELTAINQYFIHAAHVRQLGLRPPGREASPRVDRRDEGRRRGHRAHPVPRRRAEHAAARLRSRWARPCSSSSSSTATSSVPPSSATTAASRSPSPKVTTARATCSRQQLRGEEEHLDWIESQLELIRQVGLENYLSQQIRD